MLKARSKVGFHNPLIGFSAIAGEKASIDAILSTFNKPNTESYGYDSFFELLDDILNEYDKSQNLRSSLSRVLKRENKQSYDFLNSKRRASEDKEEWDSKILENIRYLKDKISEKGKYERVTTKTLLEKDTLEEQKKVLEKIKENIRIQSLKTLSEKRNLVKIIQNLKRAYPDLVNYTEIERKFRKQGLVFGEIDESFEYAEEITVSELNFEKIYQIFRRLPNIEKGGNTRLAIIQMLPDVGSTNSNLIKVFDLKTRNLNPIVLSLFQRGKTFDLKQSKKDMKSQLFNILSSKGASQDALLRQLSVANKELFGGIRSYSQLEATGKPETIDAFNRQWEKWSKGGAQPSIIVEAEYAEELFKLLKEIEKSHEQKYSSYFPEFEMPESYADLGFVPINTTKFLDEESGIDNLLEEMEESVVVEDAAETKLLNVDENFNLTFNQNLILDVGVKSAVMENLEENPNFIERFLETVKEPNLLKTEKAFRLNVSDLSSGSLTQNRDAPLSLAILARIASEYEDPSIANELAKELKALSDTGEGSSAGGEVQQVGDAFGKLSDAISSFKQSIPNKFKEHLEQIIQNKEDNAEFFQSAVYQLLVKELGVLKEVENDG